MNDSLNDSLAAAYRVVYEDIMKTPLYNGKGYDHEHADPMFIACINSLREFIQRKGEEQ